MAAEGTHGAIHRPPTAMDDRPADRDDRQTVFPRFVTSNRHIKNTRCVQNTLDPVYSVDSDSELRFEPFPHPGAVSGMDS